MAGSCLLILTLMTLAQQIIFTWGTTALWCLRKKGVDGPPDPADGITAAWHTQDLGQHFYPVACAVAGS